MKIRRAGSHALLIEVDDPAGWYAALADRRDRGELRVTEIVPGARTVLLDGLTAPDALAGQLPGWGPSDASAPEPRGLVEIPVRYDGADLPFVADHWGTSVEGVVARLSTTEFTVQFCGFAPGFAYLSGLPVELSVPRLEAPRSKVPAGSVALAGEYAGVYPSASPGGWRLVGSTEAQLFDAAAFDVAGASPALLVPGTRVRFCGPDGSQQ